MKSLLIGQVVGSLQTSIQGALDGTTCQGCSAGDPTCPQLATATSTCAVDATTGEDAGTCLDDGTGKCVPAVLGFEGRLVAAKLLPGLGAPEEAQLDLSVAAGGTASCDTGINLGMRGGALEARVADCVVPTAAPALTALSPPAFDVGAPVGGYDLGLSVSRQFVDQVLHHTEQSGTLCLSMSSDTVPLLTSGLFTPIIPSLGKLVGDGVDVPMRVALRPSAAPKVAFGAGTYDPDTKKPIDPLLTVTLNGLNVDFYALLDDRQVRLFTLTADVSVPLSLVFEGCATLTPAIGDLTGAVTNVQASNSEIVAENLEALESLIPAFIGLAEPALSSGIQPFELPPFGDFKLKVVAAKGLTPIAGTPKFEHLGLYAKLLRSTAACALTGPTTHATLARSELPRPEQMRAHGQPLPWPKAVLQVSATGSAGNAEFATRVNHGLWTDFFPAKPGGELTVAHPAFVLQGRHLIEVRSRYAEHPRAVSAPVEVGFTVDYAPPEVTLRADATRHRLEVRARDTVSAPGDLRYSYRVGNGPFCEPGPSREIDLDAVEAAGGLTVRVADEQGNTGEANYRVPTLARTAASDTDEGASPGAGCSATPGALGWAGLLFIAAARRRRRP